MALSLRLATIGELKTMTLRDLHDLLEVATIDGYNRRLLDDHNQKKED